MSSCFYFSFPFTDGTRDNFYAPLNLYDGETVYYGYIRPDGTREPPTAKYTANEFFDLLGRGVLKFES